MSASFFGVFLVDEGFVTASQLEEALALQRAYQALRVGEILVQMGTLKRDQLAAELRKFAPIRRRGAGARGPTLGQFDAGNDFDHGNDFDACDDSDAGDDDLESGTGADTTVLRFGEHLVGRGKVSRLEVERALARQQRYRTRRLGELLVGLGYLTRDELAEAIRIQFQRVATA